MNFIIIVHLYLFFHGFVRGEGEAWSGESPLNPAMTIAIANDIFITTSRLMGAKSKIGKKPCLSPPVGY
jgi:hypothetical protein